MTNRVKLVCFIDGQIVVETLVVPLTKWQNAVNGVQGSRDSIMIQVRSKNPSLGWVKWEQVELEELRRFTTKSKRPTKTLPPAPQVPQAPAQAALF